MSLNVIPYADMQDLIITAPCVTSCPPESKGFVFKESYNINMA